MSPLWLLACIGAGVVLFAAGHIAEGVLSLRSGRHRRWVWFIAMFYLSTLAGAWLLPARSTRGEAVVEWVARELSVPTASRYTERNDVSWTIQRLGRATSAMIPAYTVGSTLVVALLLSVVYGRHRRARAQWDRALLHGVPVLISEHTGPALSGIVRPQIVLPRWVLGLGDAAQRSILVHESEHRRAGDHLLHVAACTLLVVNAWNPMIWLFCRRFLRAVEFDCDERVVSRGIAPAEYAGVLLDAYRRSSGWSAWLPSPALAERVSGLGQRVQNLFRPQARNITMKTITGSTLVIALAALTAFAPSPTSLRASTPVEPSAIEKMKGALNRLIAAQEAHYADRGTYTTDITALSTVIKKPFNADSVWVTVIFAGGRGWTGQAAVRGVKNVRCVVYIGDPTEIPKLPKTFGQQSPAGEAAITCDNL